MKSTLPRALSLTLCALLCLATLLSATSCFLLQPLNQDPETVYGSLLDEYAVLIQAHQEGTDLSTVEAPATAGLSDELFRSLKTLIPTAIFQNASEMGYAFYDLDRDGTYECFLMNRDGSLYALYAVKNGSPYLVENYCAGTYRMSVLLDDGSIYTYHTTIKDDKVVGNETRYSRFEDGEMVPFCSYVVDHETDTAYAIEDGVKRDFAENENAYLSNVSQNFYYAHSVYVKEAGLWFRSIADLNGGGVEPDTDKPDTADKPVFDASSYEALLETLTVMMPMIREFNYGEWIYNQYDDAMTVESPEEFRTYINLLYACGTHAGRIDTNGNDYRKTIGYAYKDINGDGSDELFILNEDSDIIALFTLQKDTPVMLWRACDGAFSALDENGRLLATRYADRNFTSMEYFAYELTRKGELVIDEYLLGSQNFCKAMTSGETVTVVDYETFRAEYKRIFDKNIGEFWNEGGKMLTFTPLPEGDN